MQQQGLMHGRFRPVPQAKAHWLVDARLLDRGKTYSSVFGFWDEEEDDYGLDCAPGCKNDIDSPANVLQGNRPGELVQETSCKINQ
jgi:hypothetical protein